MRQKFFEYYQPTKEELQEMWSNAIFVFDTSALLNTYRYTPKTSTTLLDVMSRLAEQELLWMPYQVALEYHRNYRKESESAHTIYGKSIENLNDIQEQFIEKIRQVVNQVKNRTQSNIENWEKQFADIFASIISALEKQSQEHKYHLEAGVIDTRLTEIFEGLVSYGFSEKELEDIYREGKDRYAEKKPPGYKDEKEKQGNRVYGDLVIWKEMIAFAEQKKCPIIFITDDGKEDWFLEINGKKRGPRPELRREMIEEAKQHFYCYTSARFLQLVDDYLEFDTVDEVVIKEVEEVSESALRSTTVGYPATISSQVAIRDYISEMIEHEDAARRELIEYNLLRENDAELRKAIGDFEQFRAKEAERVQFMQKLQRKYNLLQGEDAELRKAIGDFEQFRAKEAERVQFMQKFREEESERAEFAEQMRAAHDSLRGLSDSIDKMVVTQAKLPKTIETGIDSSQQNIDASSQDTSEEDDPDEAEE